jgi:hypothetical protein
MSLSFRLQLPAEAAFRPLAADAAGRFAEVLGGSPTETAAFSAAVDDALAALGSGADPVDVAFRAGPEGPEAEVHAGGQSRMLRGTVSAPKG